jgi:hypothetical protein
MGLFKSMKDLTDLTKDAKKLQNQQLEEQGYKKGMRGQMAQMGDMIGQSKDMLADVTDQSGDRARILAEGRKGEGVIVGMGTPERGATWFNMDIDLEVHISGKDPYRVNNMYMVPASAQLGQGVTLPIAVDQSDDSKIAIDWDKAPGAPAAGQVRPAAGGTTPPAQAAANPAAGWANVTSQDSVAKLEKLAKLKESGALTDAEFEAQKAKILGE